jgi:hypothetical protein
MNQAIIDYIYSYTADAYLKKTGNNKIWHSICKLALFKN